MRTKDINVRKVNLKAFFTFHFSFFTSLLLLAVTMTACTKDEPNPLAESTGDLIVTPASITFPIEGSTQTFTVTGGTAFVRSNADWATVKRLTGNNKSSTFEVTCAENTTGASRTGTILANLNGAYKLITILRKAPS